MKYQSVKGTEDFYPAEQAKLNYLFGKLSDAARRFGFLQVEPPVLESFKLLSAKAGDEVKSQIFMLEKRSDEEVALRPEFTPGFARMYVAKMREMPKPVKWYTINRVWRYEAPQKGRSREFFQFNVELYGSDKPEADADVINLMIASLECFGLTDKDVVIKVNNRKLLSALFSDINEEKLQGVFRIIDKVEKISPAEFASELEKLGLAKQQIDMITELVTLNGKPQEVLRKLRSSKTIKLSPAAENAVAELEEVTKLVPENYLVLDLSIIRGFAYYTGIVFEARDRAGAFRAIAGGGRYDNLIEVYGGEKTPATGFAMGDKVLSLFLAEKKLLPQLMLGPDYYVAPVDEKSCAKAWEIAGQLRKKYTVDVDLMRRKLAKQFDYANAIGAKKIVIVGEKDLKEGKVTVRELASGKEEKVSLSSLK